MNVLENNVPAPRSMEKGGKKCSKVLVTAEIPLQAVLRTAMKQVVALSLCIKFTEDAEIHSQPMGKALVPEGVEARKSFGPGGDLKRESVPASRDKEKPLLPNWSNQSLKNCSLGMRNP